MKLGIRSIAVKQCYNLLTAHLFDRSLFSLQKCSSALIDLPSFTLHKICHTVCRRHKTLDQRNGDAWLDLCCEAFHRFWRIQNKLWDNSCARKCHMHLLTLNLFSNLPEFLLLHNSRLCLLLCYILLKCYYDIKKRYSLHKARLMW